MTVGSICCREVLVAYATESVVVLARRMRDHNVGTLVVVNGHHEPVGMVTDRDLALRVLAERLDPDRVPVEQLMTALPECVTETTSLDSALSTMRSGRFRRVPVVDESGRLVGILAIDDVLELLTGELTAIDAVIRSEAPVRAGAR